MQKLKLSIVLLLIFFLIICFIPVHNALTGWVWGYDGDNYRDMSNVNNMLSGNFAADPCYIGEFRWYNPLLHWLETLTVKLSGLSVNIVLSQGGQYFNLLGPICFFIMMSILFDYLIAISATAAFLFFTANNIEGWCSATYTPWLYPVTFMQFAFYIGIGCLYKAFLKEKAVNFILLGFVIGLVFLGHTGPALILILQMIWMTIIELNRHKKEIKYLRKILANRINAASAFLITSIPLLIFVLGKYKLHMTNNVTYEYADPLFQIRNIPLLIKENITVSFIVSIIGFYFLIKSKINPLLKNIIYSWLAFSLGLYIYVTAATFIRFHYNIALPGIVPSFHFFFYFKAWQAVLFGYGFVEISNHIIRFIADKYESKSQLVVSRSSQLILITLVALVLINYPSYLHRKDFTFEVKDTKDENVNPGKIECYQWIYSHTNINDVFLCDEDEIHFPVLASGRKMVVCSQDHTNPYVDYNGRKKDRDLMYSVLKGNALEKPGLFKSYDVKYVLVPNSVLFRNIKNYFPEKVFSCATYSIYGRKS